MLKAWLRATDAGQVPTHEELPDPDAFWRLDGGRGTPPSRGGGTPQWDPSPPGPEARPVHSTAPYHQIAPRRATPRAKSCSQTGLWCVLALLGCIAAIVAMAPEALDGPAQAIVNFMNSAPAFPQAIVFIALGAIPVTLLHELGHALAARRLLGTPVAVAVGSVGKLAELELGRIIVSLNALGSPGRVDGSATFDASRARAFDILLIALAGPAASAIGLIVSLELLWASAATGVVHSLLWAITLGGVFAVLNLIPFAFEEQRGGPSLKTDGRLALDAAQSMRLQR